MREGTDRRQCKKKRIEQTTHAGLFYSSINVELRTFAANFSSVDFFLEILPLKDDELVMSEM